MKQDQIKPSLLELLRRHGRVAIHKEYSGAFISPTAAYDALRANVRGAAILESSLVGKTGRFSFLHLEPNYQFTSRGNHITVNDNGRIKSFTADPIAVLRARQKKDRVHFLHPHASYTGGLIGYMAYDAVRLFEDIPDRHRRENNETPDFMFRAYRNSLTFDHHARTVTVASVADVERDGRGNAAHALTMAEARIKWIIDRLEETPAEREEVRPEVSVKRQNNVAVDISDEDFCEIVLRAKDYIKEGDIFQVVLSRRFQVPFSAPPFEIYRALKSVAPAPFMFFLDFGRSAIVGASPEKLISLEGDALESCPLAGTRPRGRNAAEDLALEKDLLADEKELAEHIMLVDLARNDLGALSVPGSVHLKELMSVERYSHVMHLSSTLGGRLSPGKDAFDALRYALPAGTLSGAPKIRAMEIIDELERSRRGIYGGTVCAIDNDGNLNSCIVIRTAVLEDGVASVRAGAGIVHQSDPQAEADETRHKASSLLSAIAHAGALCR